MDPSSVSRLVKPSSGMFKGRPPKQSHPSETVQMDRTENDNHGPSCNERTDNKKKGHCHVEVPDLCTIPETAAEKFSYGCPYCEAVFATKVHLQQHKLWNHSERVNMESKIAVTLEPVAELKAKSKLQKKPVKENSRKRMCGPCLRPMENSPSSPVFLKVKKTQETSQPSRNGECTDQRTEKKQQHSSQQHKEKGILLDAGGSESEGSSLPPTFPEEDPERMKHRRKQKTPKKFTGEQPSISGTFGLKGMNKVDEKLKIGRTKRPEGPPFNEGSQKKQLTLIPAKREPPCHSQAPALDSEAQDAILEHSEVSCSTCSIVTYKICPGFKKHLKICQKLNYTRPGLPTYNPETLDTWKNEVKEKGFICCPNSSCEAIYSSVSGLKAHLTSCIKGGVIVGKYTCLLCQKEFSSESGVKYHICKTHSQTSAPVSAALTSSFCTPCCPLILIQNWFRATGHVSNSKNKDSQSNNLQKDMKNGVPWKKRGRKPKERLAETASTREKTLSSSNGPSMNHQTPHPNTSPTPIQTSSQNPACTTPNNIPTPTDDINLTHNRDLQPPVKKRGKPKKAPLTE
ncbi:zinc finger protein 512B isoform X6 [Pangasianodon hypophthalmus]|uniref:zinc finger protein 512B isoform X6 n=1 Tax=Pangasianodon hypophthalmus TaxID=310915 RepID=UPI00230797A0|nr:zinc finger protein 512B isoform X6 [Pangasianodon hypophthalmus]